MNIAVVGCGYVFDHYMSTWERHPELTISGVTDIDDRRLQHVGRFYDLPVVDDLETLLGDPEVDIVVNLTSIPSHHAISRAALLAGKHVYSEKPLTGDLAEARELMALAESKSLRVSCAPSNVLSATTQTMWQAVVDGAVGDVRLVYAEFDDNPVYLMEPEGWRSRSGAPWPYLHEYEMGCTWEHAGYHLSWMCAMFGPVRTVTAFSDVVHPDKTVPPLPAFDTPDFSIACLRFDNGVVARLTCSIGAPQDHRMRIIGNEGMLQADTYRHYRCPVYLERFSKLTLNARRSRSVRTNTLLQRMLGVGGRRLPLIADLHPEPATPSSPSWQTPSAMLRAWKRREVGQQDKVAGIAELARALKDGRPSFPPHDFTLHLTELTMAIQSAGTSGGTHSLESTFDPLSPVAPTHPVWAGPKRTLMANPADRLIDRLHTHS